MFVVLASEALKKFKHAVYFFPVTICVFLLFVNPLAAEIIKLKSGRVLHASITERDANSIKIDFEGVPLTFYKDEIDQIEKEELSNRESSASPVPVTAAAAAPEAHTPDVLSADINDQLIATAERSVVVISTVRDNLPSLLGTGFFVSADGLVATNLHVVFKAKSIGIKTKDGNRYPVEYVANYDEDRDLCLLKVDIYSAPALPLGDSDQLTTGQKVFTVGHPQGQEYQSASGQYIGKRTVGGEESLLSTLLTDGGNSGGPIIDSTGKVIGISSAAKEEADGYNYGIPINAIKKYLNVSNLLSISEFSTHISKTQELVYYGRGAQEAGNNSEAIDNFKQAIAFDPKCLKAWIGLGEIYRSLELEPEALSAWEEVSKLDPDNGTAHAYLGKVYVTRHLFDQAILHLQKAIDLSVKTVYVYNDLGFAYGQKGMSEQAMAAYKKTIEIDPQFATGYYNLAAAYYNKHDFNQAKEYCAKAAELGYDVPESFKKSLEDVDKVQNIFKFK